MANKVRSKGTAVLMEISSVYTAIPQVKSVSISGAKSETADFKTLDQSGAYVPKIATGYTEAPSISVDIFRDPDDTVQAAFLARLTKPATISGDSASGPVNFKITYADDTPLSEIYSGVGFGFDTTASPSDPLSATITIETSGAPS